MRIKFVEMQTPDGLRSAYIALPDGAYDENWKSSSITALREGGDEASVRDFIARGGLEFIVDREKCTIGFPNPIDGVWHSEGGETKSADESFVMAFSSSALPSGAFSEGWRTMGDVHYLVGEGSGASLALNITALYPTNGLAAAVCAAGGELSEAALASAAGSPVPAYLLNCGARAKDYFIRANRALSVGGGRYMCDYNPLQRVYLSEKSALDREAGLIMWEDFFHVIRRTNTSPEGDVDRRVIPEDCGFEWHTDDPRLGDNGGLPHSWIEHCPASLRDGGKPVPLFLFSHGMSDNPLKAADMIKLHELGEREGFITVYTFASNHYGWNLSCDPEKYDDVAFYVALIAYLKDKYPVDGSRIYLSGFSNGAGMAMTFALCHPELIAAICPVDSTFPYAAMGRFRMNRAEPYIQPIRKPGDPPPRPFAPPKSDPEQNLAPMRAALARQSEKRYIMPVMYFYGSRESEYPIMSGSNQEIQYNFWKKFNGIPQAETIDGLSPDAVGIPGNRVVELKPSPAHPTHIYTQHIFYTDDIVPRDYYNFMLMHGKAHEVHPAERELGWAFVSRFSRGADGSLYDSKF